MLNQISAVLFDEKTSDAKYKNRIAYVVAHELAHQWFGNLVTMEYVLSTFPFANMLTKVLSCQKIRKLLLSIITYPVFQY
jgi:hypothetical protein